MGRKPSISPEIRAQIVVLSSEGYSERELARRFKWSKNAVHMAICRFKESKTFSDRPRSGRPRATTSRDDSVIKRVVLQSPSSSCRKIQSRLAASGTKISLQTVSRRLSKEFGLKSCKPAAKPRLTPVMKRKRLDFARKYRRWTIWDWSKVLFSDESTVQQFNIRKAHIRRPKGTRYDEKYTIMKMKHPPTQMVWGAMSAMGTAGLYFLEKSKTMNGDRYLDLLKSKLNIHMAVHGCDTFMHDGAPCHRCKKVSGYLAEEKVDVLDWPGNSPDLNPIENLWTMMKNNVAERQPSSGEGLTQAIKEVWVTELSPDYCRTLVESMPRRLEAVIKNKGGHTKY